MRIPERLLGGMLIGAGAMYLLDPDRGNRRRALLRDKGIRALHKTGDGVETVARDFRNRTTGAAASIRSRLRTEQTDDEVLRERVRAALGRAVSHPGAVDVEVRDGRVTLSGAVLAGEHDRLISTVRKIRGVTEVQDRLEPHSSPDEVPALQGGRSRQLRSELLQENWSPAIRVLAGTAGGVALARGIAQGGTLAGALGVLGAGLLGRAVTNLPLKRLIGLAGGRGGVDIQKTIHVAAPIETVWASWSNFENFPRFMSHLRDVRKIDDRRSHWVAMGPAGIPAEWDAEITEWIPLELIAWKSVEGSVVRNAGRVRFRPGPNGTTEIDIRLSYNPPAGAIGHAIASLLGSNPRQALEDDIVRLKSLLEQGKTSAHGEEVNFEETPGASGIRETW